MARKRKNTGKRRVGRVDSTGADTGAISAESEALTGGKWECKCGAWDCAYCGAGASTGEVEIIPVATGVFQVTNDVRIDDAALAAELAAIENEAAPAVDPAAPAEVENPTVQQAEEGYRLIAYALVAQGSELLVPNWQVTPRETTDLSDAIVQALMIWFPDGLIPPKYMALLVIAGVAAKITIARRDPETGALKPAHAAKPKPAPAKEPAAKAA